MIRSLCVALSRHHGLCERIAVNKVPNLNPKPISRTFSVTSCTCKDDGDKTSETQSQKKMKGSTTKKKKREVQEIDPELADAAVKAAKSLPGNWAKTADELLDRLQMHRDHDSTQTDSREPQKVSLLSTMKVGRAFDGKEGRKTGRRPSNQRQAERGAIDDSMMPSSTSTTQRRRPLRKDTTFKELYNVPRLGIFDAEKVKKMRALSSQMEEPDDLWKKVKEEKLRLARGAVPRNAFEEMIQWTKEGKMWTYPVDNEADMVEERKYKFHEHVFLDRHLKEFPDKGPLRQFMQLVVLGLGKNPWYSVPEKIEHIQWFADYFREKQEILEPTLGSEFLMKPAPGEKLE